jgi:hypothetical protein
MAKELASEVESIFMSVRESIYEAGLELLPNTLGNTFKERWPGIESEFRGELVRSARERLTQSLGVNPYEGHLIISYN